MLETYLIHPVRRLAQWSAMLAAAILMVCVGLTVFDIVLRNWFASGLTGMVELTQLAVIWSAFLTIPFGFAYETHISVDLMERAIKPRLWHMLRTFAALAGAIVMALYAWWGSKQALHQIGAGERTLTLGVPIDLYWIPVIYGTVFSVVAAVTRFLSLFTGRADKASEFMP